MVSVTDSESTKWVVNKGARSDDSGVGDGTVPCNDDDSGF